jgi:hypothetical protein
MFLPRSYFEFLCPSDDRRGARQSAAARSIIMVLAGHQYHDTTYCPFFIDDKNLALTASVSHQRVGIVPLHVAARRVQTGDTQHPILAIGRTDWSNRRFPSSPHSNAYYGSNPPTSYIPPNLRYSAIFCDAAADGLGMTSHWSPTLRRRSARTG